MADEEIAREREMGGRRRGITPRFLILFL